jgi:hypothetical protein
MEDRPMLDRGPYRLLMALLFVPGPFIIAMFSNASILVMALAPIGGAIVGLGVASFLLRDHNLPFSATWGDVRQRLTARS